MVATTGKRPSDFDGAERRSTLPMRAVFAVGLDDKDSTLEISGTSFEGWKSDGLP
jgi:hypothetical protein